MVLSSQAPRPGKSRQYMSSKRRRGRLGQALLLLLGVVLVVAIWWIFFSGDGADANAQVIQAAEPADQPELRQAPPVPTLALGQSPTASATPAKRAGWTPMQTAQSQSAQASPPVAAAPQLRIPTVMEPGKLREGMQLIADGKLVQGRRLLSAVLFGNEQSLSPADAQAIRDTLTSVNQKLVFSPEIVQNDPIIASYTVQPGDRLARLAPAYKIPYPFIEQINRTPASRLQVGQTIKLLKGPVHARVSKSQFRMDLFVQAPDGLPVYLCSFPVGLGEDGSTPVGAWRVTAGRKVQNPAWANPRTGEYYERDDPKNPIGEYWLALEGIDGRTRGLDGYGIHGTTDPDSIGEQRSMGCIRLRDDDVKQVYHMLEGGHSTVDVRP